MSKLHYIIGTVISIICFGLIAVHLLYPPVIIDQITITLLAIAIIPWLTPFFKKFKVGPVEGETHTVEQGSAQKPLEPRHKALKQIDADLSDDAKRILGTLWKYQHQSFPVDSEKRWSFRVLPHSNEYASFVCGFGELLKLGYVAVSPENGHCMLTNDGIKYLRDKSELQKCQDIYRV